MNPLYSLKFRYLAVVAISFLMLVGPTQAGATQRIPTKHRLVSDRELQTIPEIQPVVSSEQSDSIMVRKSDAISKFYDKWSVPVYAPLVFAGYRTSPAALQALKFNPATGRSLMRLLPPVSKSLSTHEHAMLDSLAKLPNAIRDSVAAAEPYASLLSGITNTYHPQKLQPIPSPIPGWLTTAIRADIIHQNLMYDFMLQYPRMIDYAYWDLPVPPALPDDDTSFEGYIRNLELPTIDTRKAVLASLDVHRTLWLHYLNTGMQFSQAFISNNWYQGGNDYVALLFNFNWNVDLNTVYYPKWLFQSSLSYKLGVNSTPTGSVQKYSISQDQLQYNLKLGYKAIKRMFWSFNLRFNTPTLNTYPANSEVRTAAFMAPGSLNIGLGMTYNYATKSNNFKISASVSPISYNLKTCFADDIDHLQFKIPKDRYVANEVGSSMETNSEWKISSNINWKSRIFLFTDYDYFQADWENTISFEVNRFLSTQLYLRPRYDSSIIKDKKWGYWMFKEILSFGLSYTFNSKV